MGSRNSPSIVVSMRTPLRLRRLALGGVCVALACRSERIAFGGPNDPVASVGITLSFPGYISDAFLSVGEKDTVRAQAYTGGWPSFLRYDSSNDPRRFTYSSSNPAVASVNADGVVDTHGPGATSLFARVDGITSPALLLTVSPHAASLVAEPESVMVAAGDKFTISVKALGMSGESLDGVVFNAGVDTTYWAVTSVPDEGSWKLKTPTVLHFLARTSGRVRILLTTPGERLESRFTASVPITVSAP